MGGFSLTDEALTLLDAELVLLIDHGEAEIGQLGIPVQERVGSYQDLGLGIVAGEKRIEAVFLSGGSAQADAKAQGIEPAPEVKIVLFGQNLGRGHQGRLATAFHG